MPVSRTRAKSNRDRASPGSLEAESCFARIIHLHSTITTAPVELQKSAMLRGFEITEPLSKGAAGQKDVVLTPATVSHGNKQTSSTLALLVSSTDE